MIQVYKKNELFIIENTVTDIIYPNLTREEALVLLEKFDRNETEHRCDFAIKEDDISFEYASLDDKDKTIAEQRKQITDLEAKLVEKEKERELDNSFWKQECDSLQKTLVEKDAELWKWSTQYARAYVNRQNALIAEKVGLQQQLAEKDKTIEEINREFMQAIKDWKALLAEKENTITTLIEDSKTSKEILKKQLTDKEQENERLKEEICKYEITLMDKNSQLKKQHQDKISFCIERLDKVKELLLEKCGETYSKTYCGIDEDIEEIIGNQIKQLTPPQYEDK